MLTVALFQQHSCIYIGIFVSITTLCLSVWLGCGLSVDQALRLASHGGDSAVPLGSAKLLGQNFFNREIKKEGSTSLRPLTGNELSCPVGCADIHNMTSLSSLILFVEQGINIDI